MAKPYKEGMGWAYRLRVAGQDVYRAGFRSKAAAQRDMEKLRIEYTDGPSPSGLGPVRTSVGVAFSDYARQRLPYLKGADQDARRINRYLRELNLPVISLTRHEQDKDGQRIYWHVAFVTEAVRSIPGSLTEHRVRQSKDSRKSDTVRRRLAGMMLSNVTTNHIQELIDALQAEGKKSATIHLERAELRRLFKHANAVWKWRLAGGNPAGEGLKMPALDNARERVLTNEEWQRVSVELAKYPNPYVAPLACLMLETAMRSCEPLVTLRWGHVNWNERVLELPDAKTGARKVPLGPGALDILSQMYSHLEERPQADDKIFKTTYEAVKKAWSVARERAGVSDVGLHDLRHTSATRFALEFNGNVPALKVITGHKTVEMVMRYVNVKASEVATLMHGEPLKALHTAAGYQMSVTAAIGDVVKPHGRRQKKAKEQSDKHPAEASSEARDAKRPIVGAAQAFSTQAQSSPADVQSNVVVVDFRRRAA